MVACPLALPLPDRQNSRLFFGSLAREVATRQAGPLKFRVGPLPQADELSDFGAGLRASTSSVALVVHQWSSISVKDRIKVKVRGQYQVSRKACPPDHQASRP